MNSKHRPSRYISDRQLRNCIDALCFAWERGTPPTRFITAHLSYAEIRPQQFCTAFLNYAGQFLAYHRAERVHLYSIESPPGRSLNAHFLIHCPPELQGRFGDNEEDWAKQSGLDTRKREKLKPFQSKQLGEIDSTELLCDIVSIGAYMMKGAEPEIFERLGIRAAENQGVVSGQRCGASQSIDKAARDRAGFKPKLSPRQALLFSNRFRIEPGYRGPENE